MTVKLEGLEETVRNLDELSKATQRAVLRRVLISAAEPIANKAAALAPEATGRLAFSVVVSAQLTRRQRRQARRSWVEIHVGPAGGAGALTYASFVEFGTIFTAAQPYMRPAWSSEQAPTLERIKVQLRQEVAKSAARAARRSARLAAR